MPVMERGGTVVIDKPTTGTTCGYATKTILLNCNCHSFQEVATQLMKAIHCTHEKGLQYANMVHNTGSAIVYSGPLERCEAVSEVLEDIGLKVLIEQ